MSIRGHRIAVVWRGCGRKVTIRGRDLSAAPLPFEPSAADTVAPASSYLSHSSGVLPP